MAVQARDSSGVEDFKGGRIVGRERGCAKRKESQSKGAEGGPGVNPRVKIISCQKSPALEIQKRLMSSSLIHCLTLAISLLLPDLSFSILEVGIIIPPHLVQNEKAEEAMLWKL